MSKHIKRILICPLDWGLGHLTRCIPIIQKLVKNNYTIIFGGSEKQFNHIKTIFPHLTFIPFRSYTIKYSRKNSQIPALSLQIPKITISVIYEHFRLKSIIKQHHIDLVISDNRYGLWNKSVPSIFIGHQINIKLPEQISFLEQTINKINRYIISKFTKCWIPDFPTPHSLAGALSQIPNSIKYRYIGAISQFSIYRCEEIIAQKKYDILCILSGPEPQRELLEINIYNQLKSTDLNTLIIRGTNKDTTLKNIANIKIQNICNTRELLQIIKQSDLIISRSGYTSIMDYIYLNVKALLIPTPGQPEQEYLAAYLSNQKIFNTVSSQNFDLKKEIYNLSNTYNRILPQNDSLLDSAILDLKKLCSTLK